MQWIGKANKEHGASTKLGKHSSAKAGLKKRKKTYNRGYLFWVERDLNFGSTIDAAGLTSFSFLNFVVVFVLFTDEFLFCLFQTEIAKRLNAIIAQILPFLSQEHQQQVATAVERAKQVTMTELNAIIGVSILNMLLCGIVVLFRTIIWISITAEELVIFTLQTGGAYRKHKLIIKRTVNRKHISSKPLFICT